jgi:Fe-S cluster biogenesis protein NfuA
MGEMSMRRRILTLLLTAIVALFVAIVPSSAVAGGGNNIVVVSNTTDGQTLASAATQVIPVPMDSVTSSNIAVAVNAGCTGCHSSAVAVQILIVVGSPHDFEPGNAAAAANGGCNSCGAYAYARQHWIQISGPAVLGGDARAQIDEIRAEISNVTSSILPSDGLTDPTLTRDHQLDTELNALSDQLIQVVTSALQADGVTASTLVDNTQESTPAP